LRLCATHRVCRACLRRTRTHALYLPTARARAPALHTLPRFPHNHRAAVTARLPDLLHRRIHCRALAHTSIRTVPMSRTPLRHPCAFAAHPTHRDAPPSPVPARISSRRDGSRISTGCFSSGSLLSISSSVFGRLNLDGIPLPVPAAFSWTIALCSLLSGPFVATGGRHPRIKRICGSRRIWFVHVVCLWTVGLC